jgi:deoxyribose-phosphate aldolase
MTPEEINQKANKYAQLKHKEEYYDSAFARDIAETEIDFARGYTAALAEVAEMPTERKYTAKDVDMAYIIGAFNSAKLDGLGDELKRLKELKKLPHEIVDEIRNRMSKPNTGGEKK